MKILFIARHYTYFRNFDSAIRDLAARGHQLHLAVETQDRLGGEAAIQTLAGDTPGVTTGSVPERRVDTWSGVARRLRLGLDYLRYLDPPYVDGSLRRERARGRTPRLLIALAEPPLLKGPRWRRFVSKRLHALDTTVPPPESIVEFMRQQRPDVVLITPLVDLGSQQIDYLRAARLLGIPTALAVWSWDHLTAKAYLRDHPERVIVWNETQRREAETIHHVPADRVVVTGAQCFDHWFDRQPTRTRAQFCAELGLDPARPIILFVGTAYPKGSPPEAPYAREWLEALRRSGIPEVAAANVLLRPHPAQPAGWAELDLSGLGPVATWGSSPVDERSRADYFDSLYHSAVVVGINTSAFLEAAIIGREVLTVVAPRFHDSQEGSAHFQYLLEANGGPLKLARDHGAHARDIAEALRRAAAGERPYRVFIESFIRPKGLDHAATPEFVKAVEDLASCPVAVPVASAGRWRRAMLGAAAKLASKVAGESLIRSPRELDPARLARIAEELRRQQEQGSQSK